jgi:hypothetical protein
MKTTTGNHQRKAGEVDSLFLDSRVDCINDLRYRWVEVAQSVREENVVPTSNYEFVSMNPEETADYDGGNIEELVRQIRELNLTDRQIQIICNLYHSCNEMGLLVHDDINDVAQICKVTLEEVETARHILMHLDPAGIGAFDSSERLSVELEEGTGNTGSFYNCGDCRSTTQSGFDVDVQWNDAEIRVTFYLPGDRAVAFSGRPAAECPEGFSTLVEAYLDTGIEQVQVARRAKVGRSGCYLLSWVKIVFVFLCHHKPFFQGGAKCITELSQDDVAAMINKDPSTLCRALDNRHIRTRWGIHEARVLCYSARGKRGAGSTEIPKLSALSIKAIICSLVLDEDWHNPLSDQDLSKLLESVHHQAVARRTVAKYRLQVCIPGRSERLSRYRQL